VNACEKDTASLIIPRNLEEIRTWYIVKMSHGKQKCHECRFLEYQEGGLELVFGGSFCQQRMDVISKSQ
jgi:hypothetical protein